MGAWPRLRVGALVLISLLVALSAQAKTIVVSGLECNGEGTVSGNTHIWVGFPTSFQEANGGDQFGNAFFKDRKHIYVTEPVYIGDTIEVIRDSGNLCVKLYSPTPGATSTTRNYLSFPVNLPSNFSLAPSVSWPVNITVFDAQEAGFPEEFEFTSAGGANVKIPGSSQAQISFSISGNYNSSLGNFGSLHVFVSPEPKPPVKPAAPVATAGPGSGVLSVSWATPSDNGSKIISYAVTSDPTGAVCTPSPTDSTSCVVTGLTPNVSYQFSVVATNAVGDSSPSDYSTATTVLGTPTGVTGLQSSPSDTTVVLAWTAITNGSVEAGYGTVSYEVRHKLTSSSIWSAWSAAASNSATVGSLTNGSLYDFEVRAKNQVADGPAAAVSDTPRTVPGSPASLALTAGYRQLSVAWTPPTSDGGASITDYRVRYRVGSSGAWSDGNYTCVSLVASARNCVLTGLTDATTYQVEVVAENVAGFGAAATSSLDTAGSLSVVTSLSASQSDAGVAFSVVVELRNGTGVVSASDVPVALALVLGGATLLQGTLTSSTDASGRVTFSGLRLEGAAALSGTDYTLRFSSTDLTPANHTVDHVVRLFPGAPTQSSIDAIGTLRLRNIPFDVTVRLRDAFDNESRARSAVTVTLSGAGGTVEDGKLRKSVFPLPESDPSASFTIGSSSLLFEGLVYTGLSASGGLDVDVTGSASLLSAGTSNRFSVRDIVLSIASALPFVPANGASATDVTVALKTVESNLPIAGETITFTTTGGWFGSQGTTQVTSVTDANGTATVRLTSSTTPGPVTVTGYCPGACPVTTIVAFAQRPEAPSTSDGFAVLELDESLEVTFLPIPSASDASVGYAPITHYEYSLDQGVSWVRVETSENPFTIPNLENGVSYSDIRFRGRNAASSVGDDAFAVLPVAAPYHYPSVGFASPTDISVTDRTVALPVVWDENGRPVEEFEVMVRRDDLTVVTRTLISASDVVTYGGLPYLVLSVPWWSADVDAQVRVRNVRGWSSDWPSSSIWLAPQCPALSSAACFDPLVASFVTRPGPVVVERMPTPSESDGDRSVTFNLLPNASSGVLVTRYRFVVSDSDTVSEPNEVPVSASDVLSPGVVTLTRDDFATGGNDAFRNGIDASVFVSAEYQVPDGTWLVGDPVELVFNPYGLPSAGFVADSLAGEADERSVTLVVDENGREVTGVRAWARENGSDVIEWSAASWVFADGEWLLTLPELRFATAYEWLLQATNARGESLLPDWDEPECPAEATAACPAALLLSFITVPSAPIVEVVYGDTIATVTIGVPEGSGPEIDGYEYSVSGDGGATWSSFTLFDPPVSEGVGVISGLTNGVDYLVQVRAVNEEGPGMPAAPGDGVMPRGVPSAPLDVMAQAGNAGVVVSWSPPLSSGGLPLTGYVVSSEPASDGCSVDNPSRFSCVVSGLSNGVEYVLSVRAVNAEGEGPAGVAEPVVPSVDRPSEPANVVVTAGSERGWLLFTPAEGAVTSYDWRFVGADSWTEIPLPLSLPVLITGLENGRGYCVEVRAVSVAGPGVFVGPACFTPNGVAEAIPEADLDLEAPPGPLDVIVVDGVGLLVFTFVIDSSGDDTLVDAFLLPRGLPAGMVVVDMQPAGDRGSITGYGDSWFWKGLNLAPGGSATGQMTLRMEVE